MKENGRKGITSAQKGVGATCVTNIPDRVARRISPTLQRQTPSGCQSTARIQSHIHIRPSDSCLCHAAAANVSEMRVAYSRQGNRASEHGADQGLTSKKGHHALPCIPLHSPALARVGNASKEQAKRRRAISTHHAAYSNHRTAWHHLCEPGGPGGKRSLERACLPGKLGTTSRTYHAALSMSTSNT